MQSERFRDKMVQNLAKTKRLSSKNLLNFTPKISLKALKKVGINFVHFASAEVSEIKPRENIRSKELTQLLYLLRRWVSSSTAWQFIVKHTAF
jgi:hypothetical protein